MPLPRPLRRRRPREVPPAPFIVGVPRSGTTLLRLMLDAHPQVAIPPETHFVPRLIDACRTSEVDRDGVVALLVAETRWPDFELAPEAVRERLPAGGPVGAHQAVRAFYEAYAAHAGKPRWGDKTPGYLAHMRRIEKALPEARFVHIIRDARDVALSVTAMELTGPDSVEKAARRWTRHVSKGRARSARVAHYLEVRYENLVLDPEPTLKRVCDFVELGWEAAMLDYHGRAPERIPRQERPRPGKAPIPTWYLEQGHALTSLPPQAERVGHWREDMSREDQMTCEAIAGELLAELGYEVDGRTPAERDG